MVVVVLYALRKRMKFCVTAEVSDSRVSDKQTQFRRILLFSINIKNG